MNITDFEVPEYQVDFAKRVAALAEELNVKAFSLFVRPRFEDSSKEVRIDGQVRVEYSTVDKRGREARQLSIGFEASVNKAVELDS